MQSILDGMRAGVLAAFALTLWAFFATSVDADSTTGMMFVAVAFGLIGLPQILYGTAVGGVVSIWKQVLKRCDLLPFRQALHTPKTDRRIAAALVIAPLGAGFVGAGTMAVHLMVTSGFARDSFQAQGLAAATAALAAGTILIAPLVYGAIERLFARLPFGNNRPLWTWLVLGIYGLTAVTAILTGYGYVQSLHVFSDAELQLGVASLILAPLLTLGMHRWRFERIAWNAGVPAAGLIIGVFCFVGASSLANTTGEMRALTFRHAPVVSSIAGAVIEPDTDDGDIWATGDDSDDEDDTPITVHDPDHPARTAVNRAISSGDRAQQNTFEQIPDPPKNVVFVMIDTLRQDHMGYAGYERDTTPNIDELAEDAVVFNDAYATSPHTPRTLPPIFFGRYASNINWVLPDTNFPRVTEHNTSMYEVKQDHGWNTIAKMSHFYFRERRGLNQGFDVWDNDGHKDLEGSHGDIATPRIWDKLEPTLEELGRQHREESQQAQPFSMFVHFFDPHARYHQHEEFPFDRGSTNRSKLMADYDSEIAHADSYVGRIIDKLKEEDLYDDTIFVITSDHGEAFDEHGYFFHGQTLYNTVVNVPKLIRIPGWFDREVDGPVSVIDIAPTLLDLLGLPIPDEYEGEVLTDVLLAREDVPDRPVFAELLPYTAFQEHHRAVVYDDLKLIVDFTHGIEELYDLDDDPMEQNNLADERPDDAAMLRQMLDEFME